MQMNTRAALGALMLFSAAGASSATIKVDMLDIRGKSVRGEPSAAVLFKMPFVRSDNATVAAQINDDLFIDQLGMLAPKNPGKSIAAWNTIEHNIEEITVAGESGPVLSVNFQIEGCGAYCETYHEIRNYDTSTGRRVNDDDILTPAGKRDLARRMTTERLSRFKKQLAEIAAITKAANRRPLSKEVLGDLNERRELNLECAGREQGTLADQAALATALSYYTQEHANQALVLTSGRCSNHAMRALDDVGDVSITVPYARLRPHLTAYGKSLLLGEGAAKASSIYGQLLRGRLNGNIAITMKLRNESGDAIDGFYLYDKVGKPIQLAGKREGNELTLTEKLVEDKTAGAALKLVVTGSQVTGQWTGKKQFPIQLTVP
jgi:hypothetical protein